MDTKEIPNSTLVEALSPLITKIQGEFYKYLQGGHKKLFSYLVMIEKDGES